MKTTETKYICDRCGCEIDKRIFELERGQFARKIMSASAYEQVKFSGIDGIEELIPDANCIVIHGVLGYMSKDIGKIHFCSKCTKEFKKFMKNKEVE